MKRAWCSQSGARCFPTWEVQAYPDGTCRLRGTNRAQCPDCGRWLRPKLDSAFEERLPHHVAEPKRGRR